VIGVQAPLGQQLLHITIGKREAQIPADRKQDHLRFKWRHLNRPATAGVRTISAELIKALLQSRNTSSALVEATQTDKRIAGVFLDTLSALGF
jgi:hypothetical protein